MDHELRDTDEGAGIAGGAGVGLGVAVGVGAGGVHAVSTSIETPDPAPIRKVRREKLISSPDYPRSRCRSRNTGDTKLAYDDETPIVAAQRPPHGARWSFMVDARTPVRVAELTSARVLQRSDVVLRNGELTLIGLDRTPLEAMLDDLTFISTALDAAGIDYLLVRGEDDRPVIAIDVTVRKKAIAALAAACATEPFYAKEIRPAGIGAGARAARETTRRVSALIADGGLAGIAKNVAASIYRPRIDPQGRLRFGAKNGIGLEFWAWSPAAVVAPRPNALLRITTPRADVELATVERYGRTFRTVAGMWDRLAGDIHFDIDIVFSWVDGASLDWQRARAKRMASYVIGEGDGHEARFRQLDELKYALRSVNMFAPWIRNIYIVTDSPRPDWLDEHPRVTVLTSERFFADQSALPTHNSHAVESQLHNIEGLSEHFLYSNDDMFFGRPVAPSMFFSPGGISKFIEATTRIGAGESNADRSGFENAARVNRALLEGRFGPVITRHLEHAATPLRRSVMRELEAEFPDDFARTAAAAFRQATDISVTNSLYHYYALLTGRAVQQKDARVKYVDTTMRSGLTDMKQLLKSRREDFFCLNDGSFPELTVEERAAAVRDFLDKYFPVAGPWEKPVSSATEEPHVVNEH